MSTPPSPEAFRPEGKQQLFREEAVRHYEQEGTDGEVLRLPARWTRLAYLLLVSAFASAMIYLSFGRIFLYASGPAVIRAEGRQDLTATEPCTVESIDVHPGQVVMPQQILVRFFQEAEKEEAAGLQREYELLLGRLLREPNDQSARQGMTRLLAAREQAEARLARRTLRAPRAGRVADVRIRVGQHLESGEVVVSLLGSDRFTLLAMLPGQQRPALHKGQPLRLEISGYKYSYQELFVRSVGSEIVGPAEVRHFLRKEIADAVPVTGPVVLVEAELPQPTFVADHQVFNLFDGMVGTVDVRVRSERILLALLPELRPLVHHVER